MPDILVTAGNYLTLTEAGMSETAAMRFARKWEDKCAEADCLRKVAEAYEKWEADIILNNGWDGKDGLPTITREQFDRMIEIQAMRNSALER